MLVIFARIQIHDRYLSLPKFFAGNPYKFPVERGHMLRGEIVGNAERLNDA